MSDEWVDVGEAAVLRRRPLQQVTVGRTAIALTRGGRKAHRLDEPT